MGEQAANPNILVVSDLHFGEELLPGASAERRRAVDLGASAFRDFVRYHTVRRRGGQPWRLVIAGDLFDFMSVVIPARAVDGEPVSSDERRFGVGRSVTSGVTRLAMICANHQALLADLGRFAAAGHTIDIIVGNHDIELMAPEVVAELFRQLAAAGADARALARIRVLPWFIYIPGVVWIEHGHVYDEGCSFEFNLSPADPKDGGFPYNADYAAIRYLGAAIPEIDPHGIEEWNFLGFMQYAWGQGMRSFFRVWLAYARFVWALFAARNVLRSVGRRDRRQRNHRARLVEVAREGGITPDTASAIDRLARSPLTYSFRRISRMLMLDRFGLVAGTIITSIALLALLPVVWALLGAAGAVAIAAGISRWLGKHMVTSQLPMRAVPYRLKRLVDAPYIIFGHTHDPRWQPLRGGGVYVNTGTWLPATRPGLRRSFTHVLIQPRTGMPPLVELRQWREGGSQGFDSNANMGAGRHTFQPGVTIDALSDLPPE